MTRVVVTGAAGFGCDVTSQAKLVYAQACGRRDL
jgi:hypothetical protein